MNPVIILGKKIQHLTHVYHVKKAHNFFCGPWSKILQHLKSPSCNEMMTFDSQIFYFGFTGIID
jgi:hypothetical protein